MTYYFVVWKIYQNICRIYNWFWSAKRHTCRLGECIWMSQFKWITCFKNRPFFHKFWVPYRHWTRSELGVVLVGFELCPQFASNATNTTPNPAAQNTPWGYGMKYFNMKFSIMIFSIMIFSNMKFSKLRFSNIQFSKCSKFHVRIFHLISHGIFWAATH